MIDTQLLTFQRLKLGTALLSAAFYTSYIFHRTYHLQILLNLTPKKRGLCSPACSIANTLLALQGSSSFPVYFDLWIIFKCFLIMKVKHSGKLNVLNSDQFLPEFAAEVENRLQQEGENLSGSWKYSMFD